MAKLTVKALEALTNANDGDILREDGGLTGKVRAGNRGVSVYFDWRYRFSGKVRQLAVGTWPKDSLIAIRDEAKRARNLLNEGRDPAEERKAEKLKARADQAEAIAIEQARIAEAEALAARMTVRELFERWERLGLSSRKDRGAEVRRSFEKDIFPALGDIAAEDVTRKLIAARLDEVVERGARIVARNLLGDLRQMYGFAIRRDLLDNDPTSHMKRDDFGVKVERERVLSESEIRALPGLIEKAGMSRASEHAIWIMLATCCRVGELSGAAWADVNLETKQWRIPAGNSKNGKPHLIHLSDFAIGHFRELFRLATPSPWVLPAKNVENAHVCVKSLAKQIGDRQRGDKPAMTGRSPHVTALELPGGRWTPHDLRRTGATMMGEHLGVRPDVIEKCLNHIEANKVKRIYQRQELREEQAAAWRLLGDRLALLTRADAENVVPFSRAA